MGSHETANREKVDCTLGLTGSRELSTEEMNRHRVRGMKGMNMKKMFRKLRRTLKSRNGQSLVEYSLVLALIAIVAVTVLRGVGKKVNTTLTSVNSNLP